jgi:hypothetical protein
MDGSAMSSSQWPFVLEIRQDAEVCSLAGRGHEGVRRVCAVVPASFETEDQEQAVMLPFKAS